MKGGCALPSVSGPEPLVGPLLIPQEAECPPPSIRHSVSLISGGKPAGPLVGTRREPTGVLQRTVSFGTFQNPPKVACRSPTPCLELVVVIPAPGVGPAPSLAVLNSSPFTPRNRQFAPRPATRAGVGWEQAITLRILPGFPSQAKGLLPSSACCPLVWSIPAMILDSRREVTGVKVDGWGGRRGVESPGSAVCCIPVCNRAWKPEVLVAAEGGRWLWAVTRGGGTGLTCWEGPRGGRRCRRLCP